MKKKLLDDRRYKRQELIGGLVDAHSFWAFFPFDEKNLTSREEFLGAGNLKWNYFEP